MLESSEVFAAEPKESRAVELSVPANRVVRVRMQILSRLVPPPFLRLVFPIHVNGPRAPVVRLAGDVVTSLDQQNALARRCQPVGERSSAGSGADDDHVVVGR